MSANRGTNGTDLQALLRREPSRALIRGQLTRLPAFRANECLPDDLADLMGQLDAAAERQPCEARGSHTKRGRD